VPCRSRFWLVLFK